MNDAVVYILKRIVCVLIVIYLIASAIFVFMFVMPGDPVANLAPNTSNFELRQVVIDELKLNEPVFVQYGNFMARMLSGEFFSDFGVRVGAPIREFIWEPVLYTLFLFASVTLISALVGVSLELPFRRRTGTLLDRLFQAVMAFALSVPAICAAMVLVLLNTDVAWPLHGNGLTEIELEFEDGGIYTSFAKHAILPVLAGVLSALGGFALIMRSTYAPTSKSGHVETIPSRMPALAMTKFYLAWVVVTVIAIDVLFGYHGLGQLLWDSVWIRDKTLLMVTIFLLGVIMALASFSLDVITLVERNFKSHARSQSRPESPATGWAQTPGPGLPLKAQAQKQIEWSILREYGRSKRGMIALVLLIAFLVVAVAAPLISTVSNPTDMDRWEPNVLTDNHVNPMAPSLLRSSPTGFIHPLGTDVLGRDVYSMTVYGSRQALLMISIVVVGSLVAGLIAWIPVSTLAGERDLSSRLLEFLGSTLAEFLIAIPIFMIGILVAEVNGGHTLRVQFFFVVFASAFGIPILYFRARVSELTRTQPNGMPPSPEYLRDWKSKNLFGPRAWREVFHVAKYFVVVGFLSIVTLDFIVLSDPTVIAWGEMIENAYEHGAIVYGAWGAWWTIVPPTAAIIALGGSVYLVMDTFERIFERRLSTL